MGQGGRWDLSLEVFFSPVDPFWGSHFRQSPSRTPVPPPRRATAQAPCPTLCGYEAGNASSPTWVGLCWVWSRPWHPEAPRRESWCRETRRPPIRRVPSGQRPPTPRSSCRSFLSSLHCSGSNSRCVPGFRKRGGVLWGGGLGRHPFASLSPDSGLPGQGHLWDRPESAGQLSSEDLCAEGEPPSRLPPTPTPIKGLRPLSSPLPMCLPQVVPKVEVLRRDSVRQCKEEVSIQVRLGASGGGAGGC